MIVRSNQLTGELVSMPWLAAAVDQDEASVGVDEVCFEGDQLDELREVFKGETTMSIWSEGAVFTLVLHPATPGFQLVTCDTN